MTFSYLKKLILIPIPVLLVFGFFCHTSFTQDFVSQHYGDPAQHEQGAHTSDCGTPDVGCLMQHSHKQLTIAVNQNTQVNNLKTRKTTVMPVFLVADYTDRDVNLLRRKLVYFEDSHIQAKTLYLNWPVGLARSHLS